MAVRVELRRDAGKVNPRTTTWIRARQVARVQGPPDPAAVASLVDHRGRILGHGLYSPDAAIVLRLVSVGEAPPKGDWLERRVAAALGARAALGLGGATTGYREINSEGDGLPGLVVDRFGDCRVVQITTAPMAVRRAAILAALREHAPLPGPQLVLLPEAAGAREGFTPGFEVDGEQDAAPSQLAWREHGRAMTAPAPPAQKTGAYHDQRDNRERFAELVAGLGFGGEARPRMLDLGCHVGGFALAAASRGASVVAVDQSKTALASVGQNAAAAGLLAQVELVEADMFGALDADALAGPFDAVIFDPPKIASGRRDLPRALGAMTRTLTRLVPRVRRFGVIAVCSCSQNLGWDGLDSAITDACLQLDGRRLTRLARWGAGFDHPVSVAHEAGEYLRVSVYQLL